jgi:PAS domain S-box-containing protein
MMAQSLPDAGAGTFNTGKDITDQKRTEDQLRESEERYRVLFETSEEERNLLSILMDHIPDSIYFKDLHSRFIKINRSQANLLGLKDPDQAVGKSDYDYFSMAHADQAYADEQAIIATGQPLVGKEEQEAFADERVRWVSTTKMPLLDRKGKIVGTFGISRDITTAKRREHEQAAIIEIATALREAQTRAEILTVLLDSLMALFQATSATFLKYDPSSDEILAEMSLGPAGARVTGRRALARSGVSSLVIDTRQPYWTNDLNDNLPPTLQGLTADASAGACIPLTARNQAVGAIWVLRTKPFDQLDLPLLTTIADIAATAIHRATLYEQTQRQLDRITALGQIDQAISSSFDLRTNLRILMDQVITQLGVDAADILLVSTRSNHLEFINGHGFRLSDLKGIHIRLGESLAGKVALENRLIHIPDLNLPEYKPVIEKSVVLLSQDFVAYYGLPLVIKGNVRGVLEVFHRSPLKPDPDWLDFLEALARQAAIAIDNAELFNNLQQSNLELSMAYDTTLEGRAKAMELREHETQGHTQQIVDLTLQLARRMQISDEDLVHIRHGALLHDAGMMAIPIAIINKPGPLTEAEWEQIRQHPQHAFRMLAPDAYLRQAVDIPYCHHEKWDGSGYPRGLAGVQIPLAARIFAVVDVWDALRSDRAYRPAWSVEKALAYIRAQSGRHFDPNIAEAFLSLNHQSLNPT